MEYYSSHINRLIEQLSHLPGIGAKSAQRLAAISAKKIPSCPMKWGSGFSEVVSSMSFHLTQ